MAESISLDLELIDKVGGPAKRVADALRRLEQQQQRTQAALKREQDRTQQALDRSAQGWAKLAAAAEKAKAREEKAASRAAAATERQRAREEKAAQRAAAMAERTSMRQAAAVEKQRERERAALRRMTLEHMRANKINEEMDKKSKGNTFFGGFGDKLGFRSVADYAKGAFWGNVAATAVMKIGAGFVEGAKLAIDVLSTGVKAAFHFGAAREQQRLGYRLSLGEKGGAAFEGETRRMAGMTPFSDVQIGHIMTMLNQAGLKGAAGRQAFATAGDIAAAQGRGTDAHAVEEIANQLANVKLGGTIDKQHLRALGIDFHEFYNALGKKVGKTAEAVQKAGSEGKLDPQLLLNQMSEQVNKRQGGRAGTGMQKSSHTMAAQLQRLESLPESYLSRMSESPAWGAVTAKLEGLFRELDPSGPKGQQIIASLFKAFDRIANAVSRALTPENIDRFVAGVQRAVEVAGKLIEKVERIAEFVADPSGQVAKAVHGGDAGDENVAMIERVRQSGLYREEGLRDQIAKLSPSEKADLIAAGKSSDFDYERFMAAGPAVAKTGASITVKVENVNVTPPPGADAKAHGEAVGAGLSATAIRQMERAARERGGS